ncbi:hypothetical protein [Corallibacter sp.]|uniref:hypothetical protein n=1 Tax=Corallibacter sp. TaxID=2038084 RepID=UPI003AB745C5
MFFSAQYIDIKLNQDYADFSQDEIQKGLIICDGIGEFPDSGKAAKVIVERFIANSFQSIDKLVYDSEVEKLKDESFKGGTTFISAINKHESNKVDIEYLGNGGIIHLHGDFANNANSDEPYRYGEIMIPHISPNGVLTKHISHNSNRPELLSSKIKLNLNYFNGDIILLFSDGISSLEDKVILKDREDRYWRNENAAIQLILSKLNEFLKTGYNTNNFDDILVKFNKDILEKLKSENYLEDDASLGIIITEQVLSYYKRVAND